MTKEGSMMDTHERDVTMKALLAALNGIGELLDSGNVQWSFDDEATLRRAVVVLADAKKVLRLVEASA